MSKFQNLNSTKKIYTLPKIESNIFKWIIFSRKKVKHIFCAQNLPVKNVLFRCKGECTFGPEWFNNQKTTILMPIIFHWMNGPVLKFEGWISSITIWRIYFTYPYYIFIIFLINYKAVIVLLNKNTFIIIIMRFFL